MKIRNFVLAAGVAATAWSGSNAVLAQGYPTEPIKIVVAFAPGGPSSVVARLFADEIQKEIGGTFIVENRPGAATALAAMSVRDAPADGHTLLLTAKTTHINSFSAQAQYKMSDFVPVAVLVGLSETFFISGRLNIKTLPELVAYFNERPGERPVGTGAPESYTGILAAMVEKELGVTYNKIPYNSSGLYRDALLAGTVDVAVGGPLAGSEDFIASGELVPMAIFAGKRLDVAPEVPTFAELGYPGLTNENYYAVLAKAGTPQEILEKLNSAIGKVQGNAEFAERMRGMAYSVTPRSLEETAAYFASDDEILQGMAAQ